MIIELMPVNGRKSFYGKALVVSHGKDCFLRSYSTVVAGYVNGAVERYWAGRSKTTSTHISAWLAYIGVEMSVADFYRLPVSPAKEVV